MNPQTPDRKVAARSRSQHGNVTWKQLVDCGLTRHGVAARVAAGRLFRVHHGVYAVGRPPHLPLERAAAAVLACGPGAALSHLGALALWGFTNRWPDTFDVVVTNDRRPQGITTHRYTNLVRRDITVQRGIRATSAARTLLDCAPLVTDNRRVIPDALHTPFVKQTHLADVRARFPHHPGARLLDRHLHGNPTRSPFEDDFAAFCQQHNLPTPLTDVEVAGHLVDALFPDQKLIVELDSWEFHKDRAAFETDRARDADTLDAGFRTLRLTWERLHARGDAEAARIRRLLD